MRRFPASPAHCYPKCTAAFLPALPSPGDASPLGPTAPRQSLPLPTLDGATLVAVAGCPLPHALAHRAYFPVRSWSTLSAFARSLPPWRSDSRPLVDPDTRPAARCREPNSFPTAAPKTSFLLLRFVSRFPLCHTE